jgi:hypothetical protein
MCVKKVFLSVLQSCKSLLVVKGGRLPVLKVGVSLAGVEVDVFVGVKWLNVRALSLIW